MVTRVFIKEFETAQQLSDSLENIYRAFLHPNYSVEHRELAGLYNHLEIRESSVWDFSISKSKVRRACEEILDLNQRWLIPSVVEKLEKWRRLGFIEKTSLQERITQIILNTQKIEIQKLRDFSAKQAQKIHKKDSLLQEKNAQLAVAQPFTRLPQLLENLERCVKKKAYFEICSSEGAKVPFHWSVLRLQVPFFHSKTLRQLNGNERGPIRSFDVTKLSYATEEVLLQFRNYIYARGLPEKFNPLPLYQWADFLMYEELRESILAFARKHLSPEMLELCQFSADRNHPLGQALLGLCYEREWVPPCEDPQTKAVELYTLSAAQGNGYGQVLLGLAHAYGMGGLSKNLLESVRLCKLSAKQKDPSGLAYLGTFYEEGSGGLPQDPVTAVKLYMMSADEGSAIGQLCLGQCYESGMGGLEEDKVEAVRLYTLSAEQGNSEGKYRLGDCYLQGVGGLPKDPAKAFPLLLAAAEDGVSLAQNLVGECYEKGKGVGRDLGQAVAWYQKAADQGLTRAKLSLKHLLEQLAQ